MHDLHPKRLSLFFVIVVFLIFGSRPGCSQTDSAEISGRITDPSGALVRDAVVQLRSISHDTVQTTISNRDGIYVFSFVQPGRYSLNVGHAGFQQIDLMNLTVNTQDHLEQNFVLHLGAASESVTVSATGNKMDISPSVSTSVDQNFIKDMPLNGRDLRSLIAITPGAIRTGGAGLFSFNGQRDNTNYFTVDGVAANAGIGQEQGAALGQQGAGQAPALSALGTTSSLLSLDALDQIKIQSANYMPEYGRSAGGQIQLTSRGGTDTFHGSVYDFFRNDVMDAVNSYTKYEDATLDAGLAKPPLRMNDFGGSFGGPVRIPHLYNGSKKTFFFFAYEGLRLDQPTSGSAEVPPDDVRNTANIYPALLPYIELAPLPNGTDEYGEPALFASYGNPSSTNSSSLRIDETVNDRLTIFGRYAYAPSHSSTRAISSINELDTTHSGSNLLTLGSTFLIRKHLANELRANWTKSDGNLISTLDKFHGSTLPTSAMYAQMLPTEYGANAKNSMFVFGAYPSWTESYQYGTATDNTQRQINIVDGLSWVKGVHDFKFGVDWRFLYPIAAPTVYSQNVAYYDTADLLSGTATVGQIQSADTLVIHQHDLALYAQDTWHLTDNLTLNYGLRWDYDPAPKGTNGQSLYVVENPLDPANATLAPAGTEMYATNWKQFSPRVGVAYQLTGASGFETLIKAGYGLFYVPSADTALSATTYFPHDRYTMLTGNSWLTDPIPPVSATSGPPYTNQEILAYYPGFTTPRTHEWNMSLQQNVGRQQSFTVAYVGSAGRKLTRQAQFSGSYYASRFLDLNEYYSADKSDYNSMQVSFIRNMNHGLQVLANYVWAKSLDTASGDTVISTSPTAYSVSGERGLSDFDVRHTANITFDWELPQLTTSNKLLSTVLNGWGMDGIFSAHTGKPLTVTMEYELPSTGNTYLRPDLTGKPIWVASSTAFGGKKLNIDAFSVQWALDGSKMQGNESRNAITGLGFSEIDYTLRRQFKIAGRANLQYRCDFFNLLNQTNYASPYPYMGYIYNNQFTAISYFGTIRGTYSSSSSAGGFFGVGGPRNVQMALRLSF